MVIKGRNRSGRYMSTSLRHQSALRRAGREDGFAPFLVIAIAAALYAVGVAYVGVQHQTSDASLKQSEINRRLEEIFILHKQPTPNPSPAPDVASTTPATEPTHAPATSSPLATPPIPTAIVPLQSPRSTRFLP